jgi:hypothetical protein
MDRRIVPGRDETDSNSPGSDFLRPSLTISVMKTDEKGYPLRLFSFISSVGMHGLSIIVLVVLSNSHTDLIEETFFVQPSEAHERKIIYYDVRSSEREVAAQTKIGDALEPRAMETSHRIVVAKSPNPKSREQFIWMPAPLPEVAKDLPLPDLISKLSSRLPALPAALVPAQPVPPANSLENHSSPAVGTKLKPFTVPPPTPRERAPMAITALEAPLSQSVGVPPIAPPLPVGLNVRTSPIPETAGRGDGQIEIAVANRLPKDSAVRDLPTGAQPADFAKAPANGSSSTGNAGEAALTVPNLTMRGHDSSRRPDVSRQRTILYAERVRSLPTSSLSVPLRPSSRMIPRSIDVRFQGRNVYTMVIPIENMPEYQGDWIMWFAESDPAPGITPMVRAPIPFRKVVGVDRNHAGSLAVQRVLVAATVDKNGIVGHAATLASVGASLERAVLRDFTSWEFQPATRNGVPIVVDIIIEVPFYASSMVVENAAP